MAKIIQITGTSGAGKSHLMRTLLTVLPFTPVFEKGRQSPIGYTAEDEDFGVVFVPGAYESPTGGCDTIKEISKVFDLVAAHWEGGENVVFEGLFCMNQTRGPQLAAKVGRDYHIIELMTPLATCMESINDRRMERGAGALSKKGNTRDNYVRAQNFCATMREAGARVHKTDREDGLDKILDILEF